MAEFERLSECVRHRISTKLMKGTEVLNPRRSACVHDVILYVYSCTDRLANHISRTDVKTKTICYKVLKQYTKGYSYS